METSQLSSLPHPDQIFRVKELFNQNNVRTPAGGKGNEKQSQDLNTAAASTNPKTDSTTAESQLLGKKRTKSQVGVTATSSTTIGTSGVSSVKKRKKTDVSSQFNEMYQRQ